MLDFNAGSGYRTFTVAPKTDVLTNQEGMGGKGREGITAHVSSVGNYYAF